MSINGSKNYDITATSDYTAIQRINTLLNDTPVLSTYLPLHVDPTRAIGDPAPWASRGRQFSTNPTDNSDDPLQQQLLVQGVQAIVELVRKSNVDSPVQPLQLASPVVLAPVIEPQSEEFRKLDRQRTATRISATSKKRKDSQFVLPEPERMIKKIREQPQPLFKARRQNNDLPPVPDDTVRFLRSLSEE